MNTMKEDIAKFKEKNGNSDVSQKELIWYIAAKVDILSDKIDNGRDKITENRTRLNEVCRSYGRIGKINQIILGIIFSCLGGLLLIMLKFHSLI